MSEFRSLGGNDLTNYGKDMSGVIKLSEALKENKSLQTLRSASPQMSA